MAKKNDRELDKALDNAIEDILQDLNGAMREATIAAAKQAQVDILTYAKETCLQSYYNGYKPNRYNRQHILESAFVPYRSKIKNNGNIISGSVGVEYSVAKLAERIEAEAASYTPREDGSYHKGYYGSRNYQPVDPSWVIDNYLEGIHPTTKNIYEEELIADANGQSRKRKVLTDSIYIPVKVDPSPDMMMKDFIKEYSEKFNINVYANFMAQILKKIK